MHQKWVDYEKAACYFSGLPVEQLKKKYLAYRHNYYAKMDVDAPIYICDKKFSKIFINNDKEYMLEAQRCLKLLGLYHGELDGIFGEITFESIQILRSQYDIEMNIDSPRDSFFNVSSLVYLLPF
jgi:hypothetical protein